MALDCTVKVLKERVNALIQKWANILLLQNWVITVSFYERKHLATCSPDPEYEQCELTFNTKRMRAELDWAQVEETVIHELLHCYTVPPDSGFSDPKRRDAYHELVTTRLERAVLNAYKIGQQEGGASCGSGS